MQHYLAIQLPPSPRPPPPTHSHMLQLFFLLLMVKSSHWALISLKARLSDTYTQNNPPLIHYHVYFTYVRGWCVQSKSYWDIFVYAALYDCTVGAKTQGYLGPRFEWKNRWSTFCIKFLFTLTLRSGCNSLIEKPFRTSLVALIVYSA